MRTTEENERERMEGDEIVLSDALDFFRSNWKFVVLVTLLLSVLAFVLTLLLPDQYNKRVTLSARPVETDLRARLDEQDPISSAAQAGTLAVVYIQEGDLGEVDASPTYDTFTQWVEVAVQSSDRQALDDVGPRLVGVVEDGFRKAYESTLRDALEAQISELERAVENRRAVMADLDRQIEQATPGGSGGTEDVAANLRLQALETRRAEEAAELAEDENESDDLKDALRDLPRRAGEQMSVEILNDSKSPQSRSLVPLMVLAVLSSFALAVIAAIVRTATRGARRKAR